MANNTIAKPDVIQKLNSTVLSVIGADSIAGFEKAFLIATAAAELKELLSPEYMKPIMALQGNRLGFKTDMDSKGGYPVEVVKNCLIEAVLTGVQPFGNQFNIISGNCYITKEGFGYLLANYKGLSYKIIPDLPRIAAEKASAAIVMNTTYTINGVTKTEKLDIPVKVNQYMGTDAVIGKATRKARAWLYNTITGSEVADGDIADMDAKTIPIKGGVAIDKEAERISLMIADAKTIEELDALFEHVNDDQMETFLKKKEDLTPKQ